MKKTLTPHDLFAL